MTKIRHSKSGSAIITAIGMGVVLLFVIAAVYTFSSHRMQTTILESQKVKALGLAEAGLELVIAELLNNSSFATHETTSAFEWKNDLPRTSSVENNSNHALKITNSGRGTYHGKLGDGEFKVKVALIPYKDDTKTKAIDESLSFLRVESLGKFENTIRKIEAVVNRRFPAREFLMYDGGFLSLVYGKPGNNNKNVFSTGHLYGHEGVEIGRILNTAQSPSPQGPGTTQELDDMNAIISGAGGIFIYSPINAKFREKRGAPALSTVIPKNTVFPLNGTYDNPADKEYGAYPNELKEARPALSENLKPWIKDAEDGISLAPRKPNFVGLKADAKTPKGLFFSASDNSGMSKKYRMPNGWTENGANHLDAVILDFGSNLRESKVSLPPNFNGVIYSEKDVVIKGNPPANINIVSDRNVFVAGDFNQSGDPNDFNEFYGLPQDYKGGNALTATDYADNIKDKLKDDVSNDPTKHKHHVAATVIAAHRIVYDYRSPVDCFENEIFPYMKYELAKAITDDATAKANCLEKNRSGIINAGTNEASFTAKIEKYFQQFPIEKVDSTVSSTPAEDALKDELKQMFNDKSGQFNFDDFNNISKKIWKGYSENYEDQSGGERGLLSEHARNPEFGVYKLLNQLRKNLGVPGEGKSEDFDPSLINDKPGDFLHYPEMTNNAMFISCGKQNNKFYAGPDYIKLYNKIGLSPLCKSSNIGLRHSSLPTIVHRVYGSEINLRLNKVHRISGGFYDPPTRRKVYDESLPRLGLENSKYELAGYVVISWKDTAANIAEYDAFSN